MCRWWRDAVEIVMNNFQHEVIGLLAKSIACFAFALRKMKKPLPAGEESIIFSYSRSCVIAVVRSCVTFRRLAFHHNLRTVTLCMRTKMSENLRRVMKIDRKPSRENNAKISIIRAFISRMPDTEPRSFGTTIRRRRFVPPVWTSPHNSLGASPIQGIRESADLSNGLEKMKTYHSIWQLLWYRTVAVIHAASDYSDVCFVSVIILFQNIMIHESIRVLMIYQILKNKNIISHYSLFFILKCIVFNQFPVCIVSDFPGNRCRPWNITVDRCVLQSFNVIHRRKV